MSKIWFNVTTSFNWHGPVVGIVRTEVEILNKLKTIYETQLRLCVFDGLRFVEISESDYLKKEIPIQSIDLRRNSDLCLKGLKKLKYKLKKGNSIYHLTPKFFRPLFWKAPPSDRTTHHSVGSVLDVSKVISIFEKQDVFITFGADWNDGLSKYYYHMRGKGVKVISCCYDIIPILMPQCCLHTTANVFKEYFIEVSEGAEVIMCISKKSRDDLNNILYELGARIPCLEIMRLGSTHHEEKKDLSMGDSVSSLLNSEYILYVSTIERRKNHETLYKVYHRLISQGKKAKLPKLVFVGMSAWGVQDLLNDINNDPLTKDHILMLGRVNEFELEQLYKNCLFTVFPSLYEGWGLGVAESLQHGKFVIASTEGSLPEVGGDLVWYEDPWNVRGWADKIESLLDSRELLNSLSQNIENNYKPLTWIDTVEDISRTVNRLLNN